MKMKFTVFSAVAVALFMFASMPTPEAQKSTYFDSPTVSIDTPTKAAEAFEIGYTEDIVHSATYSVETVTDLNTTHVRDVTRQVSLPILPDWLISTGTSAPLNETNRIIQSRVERAAYTRSFSHPLRC